jgi:C4-dicarboxylate transporter DctM subunit
VLTGAVFTLVMLVGVPIGLCLCIGGIAFIVSLNNPVLYQSYPLQMFGGVDSYGLIAIPLFILIGEIMNGGGITRRIIDLAMAVIGSVRSRHRSRSCRRSWCPRWRSRATTRTSLLG